MLITLKSLSFSGCKLITAALLVLAFGCSKNKSESTSSEIVRFLWSEKNQAEANIKILNQFGEPIAQAQILIGQANGTPFKGNFLTTDKSGQALVPATWTTSEHVTVDATGYIRQTLLNQNPGDITIKLSPLTLTVRPEIKGKVSGLPISNGDKLIDFALVMPSMTRGDLLNFDLNSVISPYSDTISVIGQEAKIPGNVSLPSQKESYIFPITLSKPIYRLTTTNLGAKRLFAVRGQFPFKKVMDELQAGKQFYDLVNYFSIQGGGMRDITLVNPVTTLDIPANELTFAAKIKTQPATASADEVLMIVAVSEVANTLVPTDIKKFTGESNLAMSTLAGSKAFIVNVIKRQSDFDSAATGAVGSDRVSAGLTAHNETIKPVLLPLVENPSITATAGFTISLPTKPSTAGINALATSAIISDLVKIQNGTETITNVNRRWEVIGLGWEQNIQLPNWPLIGESTAQRRLEINFVGSTTHKNVNLDDKLIEAATHVTHASTDF